MRRLNLPPLPPLPPPPRPTIVAMLLATAVTAAVGLLLLSALHHLMLSPAMAQADPDVPGRSTLGLLAHGAGESLWTSRIIDVSAGTSAGAEDASPAPPGSQVETLVYARFSGAEELRPIARINAEVLELANRGSQLVVLLRSGQWRLVWPGGSATGTPLPGKSTRALAIAGGKGDQLWAVAVVDQQDLETMAAALATTAPSRSTTTTTTTTSTITAAAAPPSVERLIAAATMPSRPKDASSPRSSAASTAPSTTQAAGKRLVLFRLNPGRTWQPYAELPEDWLVESPDRISLNVGSVEQPSVAVMLDDGQVHAMRLMRDRQWKDLGRIKLDDGIAVFDWISGMPRPTLWAAGASGPGKLFVKEERTWRVTDLEASDAISAGEHRAICMALDRIRLLYTHGGTILEQRFELNGARLGAASELAMPLPVETAGYYQWINLAAMVALMVAMFGSIHRRRGMSASQVQRSAGRLAPVGSRLAAAAIDALPIWIGVFLIAGRSDDSSGAALLTSRATVADLMPLWIGLGAYLLHTTAGELIWNRSLGKKLFGLRVVLMDGQRAGIVPILMRNILRLAELPIAPVVFIMMLYSPLRQRAGDIAATTLVVSDQPGESDDEQDNSDNDEPASDDRG